MSPPTTSRLLYLLLFFGLVASRVSADEGDTIVPAFVDYPLNQSVIAGTRLNLSVALSPTGFVESFQWRKDGSAIAGATRSSLTLSAIQASDAASYDCLVTTYDGVELFHPAAQIDVLTGVLPYAFSPTYSFELREGDSHTFFASAQGEPPFTYHWFKNGNEIAGATADSYAIGKATRADQGIYQARATNAYGSAWLTLNNLTVVPAIPINVLGRAATEVVNSATPHPIYREEMIGALNGPIRFRDGALVFRAGGSLMIWQNDQLAAIATHYDYPSAGLTIADLHAWSEPDDGNVYFIANVSPSIMALYRWRAGVIDVIARTGDPAPNGENYASFSHVAARHGTLVFAGQTSGPAGPSTQVFRQVNGAPVQILFAAGTELPGPTGPFAGILENYDVGFDGEYFVAWMQDAAGNGGLFSLGPTGQTQNFLDFTSPEYRGTLSMVDIEGDDVLASTWTQDRPDFRFNPDGDLLGVTAGPFYNDTHRLAGLSPGRYLQIGSRNIALRVGSASVPVISRGAVYFYGNGTVSATDADAQDGEVAILLKTYPFPQERIQLIRIDTASTAPVITHQPVSQLVQSGQSIVLAAFASGGGLSWQWFKDGQAIDSPTANSLQLGNISAEDLGTYTVVASNTLGEATSESATLSWLEIPSSPPQLLAEPADQIRLNGARFIMSIPFQPGTGSSEINFAWYRNNQYISDTLSLLVNPQLPNITGTYRFEITTPHGTVSSREFTITDETPANPPLPPDFEIRDFTYTDGVFRFNVPTLPGQAYEAQFSTELSGEWQSLGTFVGQGTDMTLAYAMTIERKVFFRVKAVLLVDN